MAVAGSKEDFFRLFEKRFPHAMLFPLLGGNT